MPCSPNANSSTRASPCRIGVCSWSLRPESAEELAGLIPGLGVVGVQLALGPLVDRPQSWRGVQSQLAAVGAPLLSGMFAPLGEDYSTLESIARTGGVRPDATWEANLTRAGACARAADELGVRLVTFHAGFLPHEHTDPERRKMIDRLQQLAGVFARCGCSVAFETGQETAATLAEVMRELNDPRIGVNFDPANMILYGMGDPVEALARLAPWVLQVHAKDACASPEKGDWGREVPIGEGEVDWRRFLAAVAALPRSVDLVIEREAGAARSGDVARGVACLRQVLANQSQRPG